MPRPKTVASSIRDMINSKRYFLAKVVQIDADTIRVRRSGSIKTIVNVPVVGNAVSDILVGEQVKIEIVSGKPYAYRLKYV